MNDEFLTGFRKQPDAKFAEGLYERILEQEPSTFSRWFYAKPTVRNAVIVLLALILIAACVRLITTTHRWQKVGSVWVEVQSKYTVDIPTEATSESVPLPTGIGSMTPLEAEKILGFDVIVPTWTPDGFTWDGEMVLLDWSGGYMVWNNDSGGEIIFMTKSLKYWNPALQDYSAKEPYTAPVAPGSYKEVQINGQTGVLVRGDWVLPPGSRTGQVNLKWDKRSGLYLTWGFNDVMYRLWTKDSSVTAEDLIHMAESAK